MLFMKKILRSASDTKITSADGKSLVVPFAVTVTRPSHEGLGKLDTVDCVQTCWSCLGHQVFCVSKIYNHSPGAFARAHASGR